MNRKLPLIIVLVLIAAAAGVGFWKRKELMAYTQRAVKTRSLSPDAAEPPPSDQPPGSEPTAVSPESLPPSLRPIDRRRSSRLPAPGSPRAQPFADTLHYYVLKRRVVRSPDGVLAVSPGDTVELRERLKDGRMRVYIEGAQFLMQPSDLTQELAVAREAENTYLNSLRGQ